MKLKLTHSIYYASELQNPPVHQHQYQRIYDGPDFGKSEIEVDGHQMDPTERPKELMVDEDPDTRWAFKLFPTDVIFDFGAPFVLSKIIFTWQSRARILLRSICKCG